ncbi:sensor histidine kinase [Duncaniella muris]|uniref:sensor histidine kinase n=1 Tax=Duncaniella muris TaxID=2094150 RepID=UPI0034E5A5A6
MDIDPEKSINLYRIIQEWTGNLRHHSTATCATVSLAESEGEITLDITDNGAPFDPSAVTSGGLGLENLNRRVKALQGTLNFFEKNGTNHISVKFFK